jgi:hypothetical protein
MKVWAAVTRTINDVIQSAFVGYIQVWRLYRDSCLNMPQKSNHDRMLDQPYVIKVSP